jgi:hypothetical protein
VFPQVLLGVGPKLEISQVSSFCPETEFQQHPQVSEIITPKSSVGLRLIGSRRKAVKVFYNIGAEGFLRLHLNWSQTFRYLRMRNFVQKRISAAQPTLKVITPKPFTV